MERWARQPHRASPGRTAAAQVPRHDVAPELHSFYRAPDRRALPCDPQRSRESLLAADSAIDSRRRYDELEVEQTSLPAGRVVQLAPAGVVACASPIVGSRAA